MKIWGKVLSSELFRKVFYNVLTTNPDVAEKLFEGEVGNLAYDITSKHKEKLEKTYIQENIPNAPEGNLSINSTNIKQVGDNSYSLEIILSSRNNIGLQKEIKEIIVPIETKTIQPEIFSESNLEDNIYKSSIEKIVKFPISVPVSNTENISESVVQSVVQDNNLVQREQSIQPVVLEPIIPTIDPDVKPIIATIIQAPEARYTKESADEKHNLRQQLLTLKPLPEIATTVSTIPSLEKIVEVQDEAQKINHTEETSIHNEISEFASETISEIAPIASPSMVPRQKRAYHKRPKETSAIPEVQIEQKEKHQYTRRFDEKPEEKTTPLRLTYNIPDKIRESPKSKQDSVLNQIKYKKNLNVAQEKKSKANNTPKEGGQIHESGLNPAFNAAEEYNCIKKNLVKPTILEETKYDSTKIIRTYHSIDITTHASDLIQIINQIKNDEKAILFNGESSRIVQHNGNSQSQFYTLGLPYIISEVFDKIPHKNKEKAKLTIFFYKGLEEQVEMILMPEQNYKLLTTDAIKKITEANTISTFVEYDFEKAIMDFPLPAHVSRSIGFNAYKDPFVILRPQTKMDDIYINIFEQIPHMKYIDGISAAPKNAIPQIQKTSEKEDYKLTDPKPIEPFPFEKEIRSSELYDKMSKFTMDDSSNTIRENRVLNIPIAVIRQLMSTEEYNHLEKGKSIEHLKLLYKNNNGSLDMILLPDKNLDILLNDNSDKTKNFLNYFDKKEQVDIRRSNPCVFRLRNPEFIRTPGYQIRLSAKEDFFIHVQIL